MTLQGPMDVATANALGHALSRMVDLNPRGLVVDLSGAELIDSTALAALVLAQKRARRREGDVILAGVSGRTKRVLAMTGLDRVFRIVPSVKVSRG